MLSTVSFGNEMKKMGFDFYTGVPCSFLKNLINYAINECEYIIAPNEGDGAAIASGAALSGRKAVLLIQNSGLTNAVSPLTSLNYIFQLPILGFVSLRGEAGVPDEPQHELMGVITTAMLDIMKVQWEYLSLDMNEAVKQLDRAKKAIENSQTFFFVVRKDTFEAVKLHEKSLPVAQNRTLVKNSGPDEMPTRLATLEKINSLKDKNTVQLATTGTCGRELYEVEDAPNNLYMVGSMGCISSLGLGLALTKPDKNVVVLDGDGSLIMRMGNIPTLAQYSPKNLLHIVLDNSTYDSTGGQATLSRGVDFVQIAASSGYSRAIYAHSLEELENAIKDWQKDPALTFLYLKIAKGSKKDLGRPKVKPFEVKERLMKFIQA